MSPKILSVAAGLTALGLSLSATRGVADEPTPPAPSPVPSATPAPPRVLLLSNGQVFHGPIVADDTGYLVKHKFGTIHKRRREVEGAFATLEEAYQYKLRHTPQRDPTERMKLARWCLDQKLETHARAQLEGVVALDPDDPEARAMLTSLNATAERAATRDAQVARTSGVAEPEPHEPGMLNLDEVRHHRPSGVAVGPPVILDLPPALAVRRYQEFARNIHPILQRRCARCHNETSRAGDFQLIQTRSRRDLADDLLLRTNLDATMGLVNAENLSDSRLLNLAFKPHSPTRQPLFTGPNDPAYRMLAGWVTSLQLPQPAEAVAAGVSAPPPAQAPTGSFAVGRAAPRPASRPAAGRPAGPSKDAGWPNPTEYPTQAPEDANFQTVSPLIGGPNAVRAGGPRPPAGPQRPAVGIQNLEVGHQMPAAGGPPSAVGRPTAPAPAPAPAPAQAPGAPTTEFLRDPKTGNLILDPVTKRPIPMAAPDAASNRAPKTFNLDASRLQNMLGRPR